MDDPSGMSWLPGGRVRSAAGDRGLLLAGWLGRGVLVVSVGLVGLVAVASPALAHGGDESKEGYLLVQQALSHLAHDTSMSGIDLAMEKVDDALAAADQDGVAVAEVKQAKAALAAGRVGSARVLLQGSIKQALAELGPATGEQTGTKVVSPALAGRGDLTGRDWGFLAGSLVLVLVGIGLAVRFRPEDTVGELRLRLGSSGPPVGSDPISPVTKAEGDL
jgi:hypothetical protein